MNGLRKLYRGENNWDFRRPWHWGVRISLALIAISILSLGVRGLNRGIEFEGGVSWEVKAPNVTVDQARDAITPLGQGQAVIQVVGADTLRVQAPAESEGSKQQVREALAQLAGVPSSEVGVSTVGASWGSEITTSAIRALVVFFLAVLLYLTLTLELRMAVGAIIAVLHDVIISVGVYSVFQFEVTPPTVIAFLTILGFSIYDTVVVYDKVQENQSRVGLANRLTYGEMMSLSMNQVLLRSLNTTVVSIIPVLAMLIVGAGILGAVTLEAFAIALTVGLLVGAYSSIFIAAPVVVWIKEREPKNRQIKARIEAQRAAAKAADGDGSAETAVVGSGSPDPDKASAPAGAAAPTSGPSPASARLAGTSGPSTIPPRPRKKTRKR